MAITGEDIDIIVTQVLEKIKDDSVRIDDLARTNELAGEDLLELNGGRCVSLEDLKKFIKGIGIYLEVIGKNDKETIPTDNNVFSALRTLFEISKNEEMFKKIFLRKDQSDSTKFLLKLLGGAFFGDFVTGIQGGMIDKNGDAELRSIYARKRIFTPELAYNRVTYIKGKYVISPGGGCTVDAVTDNGDGTYTVKPDLTDADALSQFPDDILTTYFVTRNEEGVLNGFEEMKFRVVSSDFDAKTFVITPKSGNNWVPQESMVLAQTGNFTDAERQTYIIFDTVNGNNSITFFDHANTWEPEPAQMPIWIGKKKGMTVAGINADDYPAVLQNILMTGLIFQIDEITGDTVRVPLDKGEWEAGQYGYYNRVSHNGALWLCISEEGTSEEPGTGNAWLKQVAEGAEGKPGLSVVGGGHWEASKTPYAANTMVTLFNCVFISKVETSEPPLAISRFKNGNFRRKPDGGYILAGKYADFTVHPDWTMLLDGRELKGTSITFLGSFATAPSNPVEGNSYYNTTDKCTYIYRNGVWMVMVSDGKDGRDYEWIYTRNNSIGITPDKPDSQQQDDYVPGGWTDDFLGVSEEFQVEWACKRTKKNGTWSDWSTPAIVHRWSKDGENAIFADLDNEMVNCALTYDGKATKAQSWTTNVTMWYGTEATELNSLTTTQPSGFTVSADKATGRVTVSVAQGTTVAETTNIEITLVAQISGQNYERKLTFTIAGVRAGEAGADAVLYSLLPSVSSVTKDKNGSYSVDIVTCTRQKTVGGSISVTSDGVLKYSLDGGAETVLQDGTGVPAASFKKYVKFIFYVAGKVVDIETVPLIADGQDGQDGTSIEPVGHWESSQVPYTKNQVVNFARGTFVALEETSEPPLAISRFKNGNYRRQRGGGYILAGKFEDMTVNPSWRIMSWTDESETLYWLDCPISAFSYTSTGSASPSSVKVTCKMSRNGVVSSCSTLWLVARKYNGSWLAHVSATQSPTIGVPALSGYTQFVVRAYKSVSDANAWNNSYVAERGIGVAQAGKDGKDGRDYEYIFQRTTTNKRPSTPATSQQDDYIPYGWTDDPQGVSDTYPYEWASMRTKYDGVWGPFCRPYPYGVKGLKGDTGATGAFPYDRGKFKQGESYVWNAIRRDKIIYKIGDVYYNFLVKNYGATVTAAPTSATGDANWEAMQKFSSIVTDTFFADGANIAGLMFKLQGYTADGIPYGEIRSQNTDASGNPMLEMNTKTGKFICQEAEIKGNIIATEGLIGGWSIVGNNLECYGFNTKINVEASGSKFMRINDSEEVMCAIRSDDSTALSVSTYGGANKAIGISVYCNGNGKAIEAYGNIILEARPDEYVSVKGLKLNVRSVSTSQDINRNDDYLLCSGNITIKLPTPQTVKGKVYHIRRSSGTLTLTSYYLESSIIKPFYFMDGRNDYSTNIATSNLHSYISDGFAWHEIEN